VDREVKRVSEERTIVERLAGLEAAQGNMQKTLDELKSSVKEMMDAFTQFMRQQAAVDQRLLAIEQDLRNGRERFRTHDEEIATIKKRCDESKWIRDAGADHLKAAAEQEKQVNGAVLTAGWAERLAWALLVAILGAVAYFR